MNSYKLIPVALITTVLLATVFAAYIAKEISFDYDIESFFSSADPDLEYYHNFRETFENDNDFVLIGITNKAGIFKQDFLQKLDSLSGQLEKFERITEVTSPTNLANAVVSPLGGVFNVPLIHVSEPDRYADDAARIYSSGKYTGSFFAADTHAVSIVLKKEEFMPKPLNDSLLNALEQLITGFNFDEYHLAGRIKTRNYYVGQMSAEMWWFALITLALLIAFLVFTFRCFLGALVPLVVLLVSTLWTLAVIRLAGEQLGLMMTMLPALLFVIGISDSVHILSKYIEELGKGQAKLLALKITVKEIGFAIFLTSFTTAIGFLSLMLIKIEPIQKFGLYAAIGVMLTFIVSIVLLPSILLLIKDEYISCSIKFKHGWDNFTGNIFSSVSRNRKRVMAITAVVALISIWGISNMKINSHFLDDLGDESPLKKDLLYFEKHFAGIRPFEMGIALKDTSNTLFDMAALKEIEAVSNFLDSAYGAGFLLSPAVIISTANQALKGGQHTHYQLPANEQELEKTLRFLKRSGKLRKLDHLITDDLKRGRITGKMKDIGSREVKQLNEKLKHFLESNTTLAEFRLTGAAQLMDNSNSGIAVNLLKGLGLALLVVVVFVGMMFRSLKVALVSLAPNMLPLIVIGGLMGFLGIELKVATALIFTISFGIAVDDTIHLLNKWRIEMRKGNSKQEALKIAFTSTGKAIIITSFILSSGFLTFLLSDFQSTFNLGMLVSITLVLALLADLYLLPVLLLSSKKSKIFSGKLE